MNKSLHSSRKAFKPSALYGVLQQAIAGWGAGSREQKSRPAAIRPRQAFGLEVLEPRVLLSATPTLDAAGVLTVLGDAGADSVLIEQTASAADGTVTISLTFDGAPTAATFSGVASLMVDTAGGDDSVRLASRLTVAATLDGGSGSNTLAGPDADTNWSLAGNGSGTVAGSVFANFQQLTGGSGADNFGIAAAGALALGIDGGGGGDAVVASDDSAHAWSVTAADQGALDGALHFKNVANLVGGKLDDSFAIAAGGSVSGLIDGGLDDAQALVASVDTLSFAGRSSAVSVDLTGETASATDVAGFQAIDALVGGAAADELKGPSASRVTWTISGADSGTVQELAFSSFEHLAGAALASSDLFVFEAGGSLSGGMDGGAGTFDSIKVQNGAGGDYTIFDPGSGADIAGTLNLHGLTVSYAGIDHQDLVGGDAFNKVIYGTMFDDDIVIQAGDTAGWTRVRFIGVDFFDGASYIDGIDFLDPSESLSVYGLAGADRIDVRSLDAAFGADLRIYGSSMPAAGLAQVPLDDPYVDSVTISGSIATHGDGDFGLIDIWADDIKVNAGVTIDTGASDVVLRARNLGLTDLENLLPVYATTRSVSIDIGAGAVIRGAGIYLVAEAAEQNTGDALGAPTEVTNFVIQPLVDTFASFTALPVKLLVKSASATITLHEDALFDGSDPVGLYATAAADASGAAVGNLLSVGYARASANAVIDIQANARINAGGAAVLISTADATANMTAETGLSLDASSLAGAVTGSSPKVAGALAISDTNAVSTVTLAQGAVISAGTTANLLASGGSTSHAEASSGLFADGAAALAFGLDFSNADIRTTVDGTIVARADPVAGYTVKIEIDPTVTWDGSGAPPAGFVD
jgi:hypothetical protein